MRSAALLSLVSLCLAAPAYVLVPGERVDVFAQDEARGRHLSAQADATATQFEEVFGALPDARGAVVAISLDLDAVKGGQLEIGEGSFPADLDWKRNGAKWVLPWPDLAIAKIVERLGGAAAAEIDPEALDAFSHELAHLFFLHLVNDTASAALRTSHNGYGSYLADWLDETAAVLHEPDAMKAMRRKQWREVVANDGFIPLEKFLSMAHPGGEHGRESGDVAPEGEAPKADLPRSVSVAVFYLQCLDFGEFVLDRYGTEFLRHVVTKFAAGHGMKEALPWLEENREKLRGVPPDLPRTVAELEKTWLTWSRRRAGPTRTRD